MGFFSTNQRAFCMVGSVVCVLLVWTILRREDRVFIPPTTLVALQPGVHVVHTYSKVNVADDCVPYRLPGELTPSLRLCVYPDKVDPGISFRVRRNQVWEPTFVSMVMESLRNAEEKGQPGKGASGRVSLVDIGCNVGTFSVVAAALGYEVLAVDAMVESVNLVHASLAVNNLTQRVTLVHNAVSDVRETIVIRYCPQCGPASSKLNAYQAGDAKAKSRQSLAQAVLFDDLIQLVPTKRVFIKIDVEASEGRALRGAQKFFDTFEVVGMLMEWEHVKKNPVDRDFIVNFMSTRGFGAHTSISGTTPLSSADSLRWPNNVFWHK